MFPSWITPRPSHFPPQFRGLAHAQEGNQYPRVLIDDDLAQLQVRMQGPRFRPNHGARLGGDLNFEPGFLEPSDHGFDFPGDPESNIVRIRLGDQHHLALALRQKPSYAQGETDGLLPVGGEGQIPWRLLDRGRIARDLPRPGSGRQNDERPGRFCSVIPVNGLPGR